MSCAVSFLCPVSQHVATVQSVRLGCHTNGQIHNTVVKSKIRARLLLFGLLSVSCGSLEKLVGYCSVRLAVLVLCDDSKKGALDSCTRDAEGGLWPASHAERRHCTFGSGFSLSCFL